MEFEVNPPKRKKVAIVGFAESSRHLAPYDDQDWDIWAMNQLYRFIPRATMWWEMHNDYLSDQVAGTDYKGWLKECQIPVMMIAVDPEIPTSIRYPIEDMVSAFGDYFYSTISYMIAYAIAQGYTDIGLWGIDLAHDSEYEYQKPSAEYLLGVAKGRKINVHLPGQSALLKGLYRYGYEMMPDNKDLDWLDIYTRRVTAKRDELLGAVNQLQGQLAAAEEFKGWMRTKRRGGDAPDPKQPDPTET